MTDTQGRLLDDDETFERLNIKRGPSDNQPIGSEETQMTRFVKIVDPRPCLTPTCWEG